MKLIYKGKYNANLLGEELEFEFPEWFLGTGEDRTALFSFSWTGEDFASEVVLEVPNSTDKIQVDGVVAAHDSSKLSILEQNNLKQISDKFNATSKLVALGLTEDEIEALKW